MNPVNFFFKSLDSELDILLTIENVKKSEVLIIVADIVNQLSMDTADVQILDNITGYKEMANMIQYGMMNISQYQTIFVIVGRFDLMIWNADYSDGFYSASDIMRERNNKAVIVLCLYIVSPSDEPSQEKLLDKDVGLLCHSLHI